jgi:hypothetical protein
MKFVFFLISVAAGLSEMLTVLREIWKDSLLPPNQIFETVKSEFPNTLWNPALVAAEVDNILSPIQVPQSIHEQLWGSGRLESIPEFPVSTSESQERIKDVWMNHCISPTKAFPEFPSCYETTVTVDELEMPVWKLTPERMYIYFEELVAKEMGRLGALNVPLEDSFIDNLVVAFFDERLDSGRTSSETVAYAASRPDALSMIPVKISKKKKKVFRATAVEKKSGRTLPPSVPAAVVLSADAKNAVIHQLRADLINDDPVIMQEMEELARGIHKEGRTPEQLERLRVLFEMMKPAWFHIALVTFNGPRISSNKELEKELEMFGGKQYQPDYLFRVETWDRWCLHPLSEWIGRREPSKAPIPCKLARFPGAPEEDWFVLSNEHMIRNLNEA